MTDYKQLCAELLAALEEEASNWNLDPECHPLVVRARAALAEPEHEPDDYKVASDKTMRRIRSTTKRWKLSLVITTNDSAIDSRLGPGIWKVLDTENEILERISIPKLLSSKDTQ